MHAFDHANGKMYKITYFYNVSLLKTCSENDKLDNIFSLTANCMFSFFIKE